MESTDSHNIQLIPSSQVDRQRWDACVHADARALVYSLSWVLDTLAEDWVGVVVNDYQAVMPLPIKTKFFLRMVYVPPFVQRLGMAGSYSEQTLRAAEKLVKQFTPLVQYAAPEERLRSAGQIRRRTNFVLPPASVYQEVFHRYSENCKKNLRQAASRGCIFAEDVDFKDVLSFYKDAYGGKSGYKDGHYRLLEKLYRKALQEDSCRLAGVRNSSGDLVYGGFVLEDKKRLYYLFGAPTTEGRQMRATYFFIDEMIRTCSGLGKMFDFEGSDIPDVAKFYQSFSPDTEYYFQYYLNLLPFPLNKLIDRRLGI